MSPIDDELRRAMRERADVLLPASDPLSGIESRARGMVRRRRTAAALSGALVVVAGVAIALPQLGGGTTKPDVVRLASPSARPAATAPANLLTWELRGTVGASEVALKKAFAEGLGRAGDTAEYRPLYAGTRKGVRFTLGQAWIVGDPTAYDVSYSEGPGEPELFLGGPTRTSPVLLAWVLPQDQLVLLPRPGVGEVAYSPTATGAFTAVASGRSDTQPVGLVDRSATAGYDRVRVLAGDGQLLLTSNVAPLLCAYKECG